MRIAQIILPILDNNGASLSVTHDNLAAELVALWQGFTVWEGRGAWQAADGTVYYEAVKVYQIFNENLPYDRAALRDIAKRIGAEAGQIAMAIVLDGESEIITI